MKIDHTFFDELVDSVHMHALDCLWVYLDAFGHKISFPEKLDKNFSLKKELFFDILKKLMIDDRLRLAKNGYFLTGTIDEQINTFKAAFPPSEESQKEIGGMWNWFFIDECPAGAVWVYKLEDGSEHFEWT